MILAIALHGTDQDQQAGSDLTYCFAVNVDMGLCDPLDQCAHFAPFEFDVLGRAKR